MTKREGILNLFLMDLHEEIVISNNTDKKVNVTRVPGGWIYGSTFVPFSTEKIPDELCDRSWQGITHGDKPIDLDYLSSYAIINNMGVFKAISTYFISKIEQGRFTFMYLCNSLEDVVDLHYKSLYLKKNTSPDTLPTTGYFIHKETITQLTNKDIYLFGVRKKLEQATEPMLIQSWTSI